MPVQQSISSGPIYTYPNNQEDYKGQLLFTTVRPEPVTLESLGDAIAPLIAKIKNAIENSSAESGDQEDSLINRLIANNFDIAATAAEYGATIPESELTEKSEDLGNYDLEQVLLYLPQSILMPDQASYNPTDLGVVGAGAEAALKSGNVASALGAAAAGIGGGIKSIIDGVSGNTSTDGASNSGMIGMAMMGGMLGQGIGGALKGATRITPNPNTRMLFQNVGVRSFTFDFDFIPVSQREASDVRGIIQWFRYNLYPEIITTGGEGTLPLAYRFPNFFRIKALYDGNDIPEIDFKDCYLQNVQTTLNSTSMSMHHDGSFPETKLTLTFSESQPLSKADFGEMLAKENGQYNARTRNNVSEVNASLGLRRARALSQGLTVSEVNASLG
jgi:hypothetical protein